MRASSLEIMSLTKKVNSGKKPRVWIVNFHSAPPGYALNYRHIEFADKLNREGYDVEIITAGYLRRHKLDLIPAGASSLRKKYGNTTFIFLKCFRYAGNGFKRILATMLFSCRVFKLLAGENRPDLVVHNIHMPFDYPVFMAARLFRVKYIAEAWDLWPEEFVRTGLAKKNNPLLKLAYLMEKQVYAKSNRVIFTMEGGYGYIKDKGWDEVQGGPIRESKIEFINNGVNLGKFEANKLSLQLQDTDLKDEERFRIVYIGSIHRSNNIRWLVEAAQLLSDDSKYVFLIYGDGTERPELEKYCNENGIRNFLFKDKYVEYDFIPYLLSMSHLNILNYEDNFGQYGLSSGKLFLYLASGKPIISNISNQYCLIKRHNLGCSGRVSSKEDYADAIRAIANLPEADYEAMCARVREVAKEYDYDVLGTKFRNLIDSVVEEVV